MFSGRSHFSHPQISATTWMALRKAVDDDSIDLFNDGWFSAWRSFKGFAFNHWLDDALCEWICWVTKVTRTTASVPASNGYRLRYFTNVSPVVVETLQTAQCQPSSGSLLPQSLPISSHKEHVRKRRRTALLIDVCDSVCGSKVRSLQWKMIPRSPWRST